MNKCNKSRDGNKIFEVLPGNKPGKDINVGASTDASSQLRRKCLMARRRLPLSECFIELHAITSSAVCMLEFVFNQACQTPIKTHVCLVFTHTKQINVPYYQGREASITEGRYNQSSRQNGSHAQQRIDWLLWRQLPSQSKYLRHHFTRSDQGGCTQHRGKF